MSVLVLSLIGIVALTAAVGLWGLCRAAAEGDALPGPPVARVRTKRGALRDGFCPLCQAPGVYLKKSGYPNRRYHVCVTADDVQAVADDFATVIPPPEVNQ